MPDITRASAADLDTLTPLFDLYRRFYQQPSDLGLARAFLAERLARDESVIFLARVDGAPAGFTQLYWSFSSVLAARTFLLSDLYVDPAARGRGVGAALLGAAADFGRSEGAAALMLTTGIGNLTAQRLYESHGWVRETQYYEYGLDLLA